MAKTKAQKERHAEYVARYGREPQSDAAKEYIRTGKSSRDSSKKSMVKASHGGGGGAGGGAAGRKERHAEYVARYGHEPQSEGALRWIATGERSGGNGGGGGHVGGGIAPEIARQMRPVLQHTLSISTGLLGDRALRELEKMVKDVDRAARGGHGRRGGGY